MTQRNIFRPQIETLESRRCLTAMLGMEGGGGAGFLLGDGSVRVVNDDVVAANHTSTGRGGGAGFLLGDGSVRIVNDDVVAANHASTGPGGGPHVKVFDGATAALSDTGRDGAIPTNGGDSLSAKEVDAVFAYASRFIGGVRVATGDINGDGTDEIITSAQVF